MDVSRESLKLGGRDRVFGDKVKPIKVKRTKCRCAAPVFHTCPGNKVAKRMATTSVPYIRRRAKR